MIEFALIDGSKKPMLLVPDINVLSKFLNGDIGIADHINGKTAINNLSKMTSPEQLKVFAKASNIILPKDPGSYFKNGKSTIKQSDITFSENSQTCGIKALEKALIQSIFESQKPYIEIAKLVIDNLITIEDIIARVLALGGSSLNPAYNPKALGYLKRDETIKQTLSKLTSLQNFKNTTGVNNIGDGNKQPNNNPNNPNDSYTYQVISTEYSTGKFDPNVNYTYEYIDIKDDTLNPKLLNTNLSDSGTNNDPYDGLKPKTIVLSIFDKNGNVLDTIPDWLLNSGKWYGNFGQLSYDNISKNPNPPEQVNEYNDYYKGYIKDSIYNNKTIDSQNKDSIANETFVAIDVNLQISEYIKNGFLCDIQISNGSNPLKAQPFKPKLIQISSTQSIWIEPESDYDMKIIKVGTINKTPLSDVQKANIQLSINTPYSSGFYGSSTATQSQNIDVVYRYTEDESDKNVYYIVEGIISDDEGTSNSPKSSSNKGGKRVYRKKDFLGSIKKFTSLLISIFSKLIPAISTLLKLISNPSTFIFDILTSKIGDNNGTENMKFMFFSKNFLKDFKNLAAMDASKRKDFVSKSQLRNYVFVKKTGEYRFLLDGSTLMEFFGITFGISITKLTPSLIFKIGQDKNSQNLSAFLNKTPTSQNNDVLNSSILNSSLFNATLSHRIDTDTTTIQYSTGNFVQGIDYTYIYVTEYINGLVSQANELAATGEPDKISQAADLYQQAIKADPKNEFLQEEYEKLKKISQSITNQPILSFLLNMVTFPLKIIKGIIEYIVNFFKNLGNVKELPNKIKDFISFKWVLDFFNPTNLLSLCGIKFDIGTFKTWIKDIKNYDISHKFDLSQIMNIPFMPKMFSVNKEQLKTLINTPIAMLSSILCLIENVINGFIDFVWGLLGLAALFPPPHIKLCKDSNKDMSPKDIMDILNGNYIDALSNGTVGLDGTEPSYDFIYNIVLPDGRNVRDLNREELEIWISENKNLIYEFDF